MIHLTFNKIDAACGTKGMTDDNSVYLVKAGVTCEKCRKSWEFKRAS